MLIVVVAVTAVIALSLGSEVVARLLFRESASSTMKCLIANDPKTGVHGLPNSHCFQKAFESSLVDYRFNECGFRTPQPCRAAPAGTFRIVLLGSSLTYGMHVDQQQSFAGLLGPILTKRLHRPVDVFNEAMQWGYPASIALRADEIFRPRPNLIVWTLSSYDIEHVDLILPYIANVQDELVLGAPNTRAAQAKDKGLATIPSRAFHRVIRLLSQTRTVFALEHYLYQSQSQYLSHTLAQTDAIDYLRVPTPITFQYKLGEFAKAFADIATKAKAAGIPIVVTLLPSRPQMIMLSNRRWDRGYDPNQLARALRRIVEAQGEVYTNTTLGLDGPPDSDRLFMPVDEHLYPEGHVVFAKSLADALERSGRLPPRRGHAE